MYFWEEEWRMVLMAEERLCFPVVRVEEDEEKGAQWMWWLRCGGKSDRREEMEADDVGCVVRGGSRFVRRRKYE